MVIPVFLDACVDLCKEFACGGDDGGLCAFAVFFQALSIGFQFRIMPAGDKGGEIERPADLGASAPDAPFAGFMS